MWPKSPQIVRTKDRVHRQANSQQPAQFDCCDGTREKQKPANPFEHDNL
jgi:hypothetical protein